MAANTTGTLEVNLGPYSPPWDQSRKVSYADSLMMRPSFTRFLQPGRTAKSTYMYSLWAECTAAALL